VSATGGLLRRGAALLAGAETPALDAKVLLLHAAGLDETVLAAHPETEVSRRTARRYLRLVERRRRGVPTAYLTGVREFWSLPIGVRPGVLIPRPETELVVETVLALPARPGEIVVDLGTGSGAFALALAGERPGARVVATDVSRRALRTARRNARRLGRAAVEFARGDLFEPLAKLGLPGGCDVIASNPPYLSAADWNDLAPGVRDYEPKRALLAGATGFEVIERIIAESPAFLKPGGRLVMEIGAGQSERVRGLFGERWKDVVIRPDLAGIPRVVMARPR
jgi:release factor glutamine methyltransferase